MSWLWFALSGLAAGVIAGMGMGGGTLLIPVLTLLLGVSQHAAQGVNMLAFLPAGALALLVHIKARRVDMKACLPIMLAGLIGAAGGALLAGLISAPWLKKAYGAFLAALAIYRLIKTVRVKGK